MQLDYPLLVLFLLFKDYLWLVAGTMNIIMLNTIPYQNGMISSDFYEITIIELF